MPKVAVEQKLSSEEQVIPASEQEQETEVSSTKETVSKEKEGGETPSKTYSEEELETILEERVQKEAQSITDKALKTYQEKDEVSRKRIAEFETNATNAKRESELRQIEGKELKEWVDEGVPENAIRGFQQERRAFNKWVGEVQDAYKAFESDKGTLASDSASNHALKLAIQYGLENGAELINGLDALVEKIKEGKTPSERELLALRESLKKGEKKPQAKKPDSSLSTAPGGIDMSKATPGERVSAGLAKLAKK